MIKAFIDNAARHQGLRSLMFCSFYMCIFLPLCHAQQDKEVFFQQFSTAYAAQQIEELKPLLSQDFSVGIYDRRHENFLLDMLTKNYACDSILYQGNVSPNNAKVLLYKKDGTTEEGVFTFDEQGLLCYADVFDALYLVNRDQPSKLVATLPFEEKNGSIILKCRINDSTRELSLLFDTGADGMAVSTALGEELGLKVTRSNSASVVGGNVQIQVSDNNTVHIGDFGFPGQGIALFDNFHKEGDGILGNTLLKKYIVRVDYDRKEMSLYSMGKYDFGTNGITLPVGLAGNLYLPISLTMNGGKKYEGEVFFDTGASYNLILFRPFVLKNRLLVDGFKPLGSSSTMSMGMSTPTYTGLAESMYIGDRLHSDNFLLTLMAGSPQNQNWEPGADGSLGIGIIGRYNFTIDLLNKRIHFEPNSRYHIPVDFVLAGHVFHFDLNKDLYIGKVLDAAGLYNKVTKINNQDVGKWLKNNGLQQELEKTLNKTGRLQVEADEPGRGSKMFELKKSNESRDN